MANQVQDILKATEPYISGFADATLAILEEMAGIDCGTGNVEGNAKIVKIMDRLLSQLDGVRIEHRFFEGYGENIIARLNPGNTNGTIIINGHLDTVFKPGDTAAHPFHIEGDTAYGLGIADCKGGIVMAIHSVIALQKAGMLPNKEILFLFGCDEELASPVSSGFYEEVARGAEMAFVFEPSRDNNGIITSRKGSIHYLIECHGKAAHVGTNYLDGASAVVELASRIQKLYEQNDDEAGIQFNIAKIYDGMDRMNVVPDYARAAVNARVRNEKDARCVEQAMNSLTRDPYIPRCSTEVKCTKFFRPMERNQANYDLYSKVAAVGKELGMELPEQSSGGYGDSCAFSSMGIPVVDALGPYMYHIHSFEESLRISSIPERMRLFCAVLGSI